MSDILPHAFIRHRRLTLTVWALMAVLNLSAAVVITSWPERQTDLDTIQRWGGNCLLRGDDVYATDWDYPDCPPHAIALLSPLQERRGDLRFHQRQQTELQERSTARPAQEHQKREAQPQTAIDRAARVGAPDIPPRQESWPSGPPALPVHLALTRRLK